MKKILLTSILSLVFITLFAQIKPKQEDWFFADFGYDYLLNSPDGISQSFIPFSFSGSIMKEKPFGKGKFAIAGGLGYTGHSFYNNLGISTDLSSGKEKFRILDTDSIERNRLTSEYIDAIFELRYRTLPNTNGKFFRWYVGVKGGVRVNSISRLRTKNAIVSYENLGALNRYKYGAYTRIGYGWINIYAYYGLSELFTEGVIVNGNNEAVTGIRPLSIGISVVL